MKIMISYFYQIRFFTRNMIPMSTAVWDPKWYHHGNRQSYQWKDSNGVWNGIRLEKMMPGAACEGLCRGPEYCGIRKPELCDFLKIYRQQLDKLDFDEMMKYLYNIGEVVKKKEGFEEEPIIVLIVHEVPGNPCSERRVIQEWFKDHGVIIREFEH